MKCVHTNKPGAGACSICMLPTVPRVVSDPIDLNNLAALLRRSDASVKGARGGRARAAKRRAAQRPANVANVADPVELGRSGALARWSRETGMTSEQRIAKIHQLREQGHTYREIAEAVPCGLTTVRRALGAKC